MTKNDKEVMQLIEQNHNILFTSISEVESFAKRVGYNILHINDDLSDDAHFIIEGRQSKLYYIAPF